MSLSTAGPRRIAVTGCTGYIGGRLLNRLLDSGYEVNALARRPEYIRVSHPRLHSFAADVLDAATLPPALEGVDTAYYLVHSMGSAQDFEELDRKGAKHFALAAQEAGVNHLVYLGGLAHDRNEPLSSHMASRMEVGRILAASGIPTTEFRASIIVGSGSLSFELIRALVERLPVMITPRWVDIMAQPIGTQDLLAYLQAALNEPPHKEQRIYEIGGGDQVAYGGLMREYARQRGLRRWMIPVPVLTPRLSSLWLGLVTPIYARVGKKLISSIRNASVVQDTRAYQDFDIRPKGLREIIAQALRNEDRDFAETRWSDALSSMGEPRRYGGVHVGTRIVDSRIRTVAVPPDAAFAPIQRIGGDRGWYYANWLWRIRGWIDLPAGGAGLRRGRRHPVELAPGDILDWWRVEDIVPGRRLRLFAEMKVPGRAWLEFDVQPKGNGREGSEIRQTALFDPAGLWGRLYWYALYPVHWLIFNGMLDRIARRALTEHSASDSIPQS